MVTNIKKKTKKKTKKKKGHGGLKFMAAVVVLVVLIIAITKVGKTEMGRRVTGGLQERRLENTRLTPRFGFSAATLRTTVGSIYYVEGETIDATTTSDTSIDRQSARASSVIDLSPTKTDIAPGVESIPFDTFRESRTEILTKDYLYVSADEADEPWTRSVVEPYYYGDEIDDHFIPMIDDLMGFELRDMPSNPITIEPASGIKRDSLTRPAADTPTAPSALTKTYSYEFDIGTYRRVLPILAGRTHLYAPPETIVSVTLGFDDVGLLRFADVSIDSSVAVKLAVELGNYSSADYHYTLEVTDISGEPITIDVPTDFVDEVLDPPDDTP